MKLSNRKHENANGLVVTVSVVATILVILGAAVEYTVHSSRVSARSRKTALAMEIGDGHLEYLFSNWRNIYRTTWTTYGYASGGTDYSLVGTNYFYTNCPTCTMTVTGTAPTPVPNMNPAATPPVIPLPAKTNFPTEPNYTVTRFNIQAIDPMINLDSSGNALVETSFGSGNFTAMPTGTPPPAAYGPNTWQYSLFYLASVDVTVPAPSGDVTAKVRRVFEKRFDNPWTYAMFYTDDLELQPTTAFTIDGPIQTNGTLYIGTSNFTALDPVSYASDYINGYSPNDSVHTAATSVPTFPSNIPPVQVSPYLPFGWNLNLNTTDGNTNNDSYHEIVEQPVAGTDALANVRLYNQADIKVLINAKYNTTTGAIVAGNTSGSGYDYSTSFNTNDATPVTVPIVILNASGALCKSNSSGTTDKNIYNMISGALNPNLAFQDQRESTTSYVRVADLDINKITADVNGKKMPTSFTGVIYISDTTTNGSVVASKVGGSGSTVNTTERGIRLINGYQLPGLTNDTYYTDPTFKDNYGLTVVSNNPVYIKGNYNTSTTSSATIPSNNGTYTTPTATGYTRYAAAVIGDAITVLSNSWNDANSASSISNRTASNTTVNAALVGGIVPSGNGNYSGGGENFIRFLEDWKSNTFCYYGSIVQLFQSKTAVGPWTGAGYVYKAPLTSKFFYDTNFAVATPPGKMQLAAYLQQQRWYLVY